VSSDCKEEGEKIKYQSEIAGKFKAIISPFLLRRVKSEINLGLKEKKELTLFVSLTDLQLKMYRNYLKTKSVHGD
jgi:SWI/SNF-related matrix-associated actin-dependent regulator of chromatin subfamily A member 5